VVAYRRILTVFLAPLAILGCAENTPEQSAQESRSRPVVFTVNAPLQYFAQRIGGEHIEVVFPGPADRDAAYWTPDGATIAAYQQADLILLNGAGFARWAKWASLPQSRVVDTCAGAQEMLIPIENAISHTHGPDGEHSHEEYATRTWLDPTLALAQCRAVHAAFTVHWPEHAPAFDQGFAVLESDLLELAAELKRVGSACAGGGVIFAEPEFEYLARALGLPYRTMNWPSGMPLDDGALEQVDDMLSVAPASFMLFDDEPSSLLRSPLAERGLKSLALERTAVTSNDVDGLNLRRYLAIMTDEICR
jgi:zinc transport system substrate-binding protein